MVSQNTFEPIRYAQKYVLFIDILGFKRLIETRGCSDILNILDLFKSAICDGNISDLLCTTNSKGIPDLTIEDGDLKMGQIIGEVKMTALSDSIVLSFFECEPFHLLQFLMIIQFALLKEGYMIRGGLSYGDIYHEDSTVFGRALNCSYSVESGLGDYPVVGFEHNLYQRLIEGYPSIANYFKENEQGTFYFDFLKYDKENFVCNMPTEKEGLNHEYGELYKRFNTQSIEIERNMPEGEIKKKVLAKINFMTEALQNRMFTMNEIQGP